ncbi:hypothetical protein [Cysteiniphilum halobium]|uniref:hypothetical protein n=1 Tax=Cysteiniphilum halobium TaxID=2219059 RepID=UPI000E64D1A4|nr:hypothetical protein [Cysteiniphilum halobium]
MNDHQKERLLKIAETNPELAKDVVDILKQESLSSHEPIAVKMVKSEEDKIEITAEQKKYTKYLIETYLFGIVFFLIFFFTVMLSKEFPAPAFTMMFITVAITIAASWYFSFKAGYSSIKAILSKHFKW